MTRNDPEFDRDIDRRTMLRNGVIAACGLTFGLETVRQVDAKKPKRSNGFQDASNWGTFDPSDDVGGKSGYSSVIRVDSSLYFVPYYGFPGANESKVLRHRWNGDFTDSGSYEAFDLDDENVTQQKGYGGAVSDGRYIYLMPAFNSASGYHGEVVRYDTRAPFTAASSWTAFDPKEAGVGNDPIGFEGDGVFDGRYVYFPPHGRNATDGSERHDNGEVLRYDTETDFTDTAAWSTFDPAESETEDEFHGFYGSVFDGRSVYFLPFNEDNEGGIGGEVVRYDTANPFTDPSSWEGFDPRDEGIGGKHIAYTDATYDGRYLYLAPQRPENTLGPWGSTIVRYDTSGGFRDPNSWSDFDPAGNGVGIDPRGYFGAVTKGRYTYFSPIARSLIEPHGEVLRYDRTGGFEDAGSWSTFDPGQNDVGQDPDGYSLAVDAGPFIYFAPVFDEFFPGWHSEILRYDTRGGEGRNSR